MIEKQQTLFENGKGNCFAAYIASILEISIEELPDFHKEWNWREALNIYLQKFCLFYFEVSLPGDMRDELISYWGYHIICGDSPRGLRHAVVGYKGEMIFDPHPEGGGVSGELEYGFFIPLNPQRNKIDT
jgi:hypothetical protein